MVNLDVDSYTKTLITGK